MRSNQKRLAQSLAAAGRMDTRDVKKTLAVVPFRHSKLTEILMDYFIGDGRVVSPKSLQFQPSLMEYYCSDYDRERKSIRHGL